MEKPKLYAFAISPTCQRVFSVLAHKNIEHDYVEIDVSKKERPAEFTKVSPFGKVPVLVHKGQILVESVVISEYLDEVYPSPAMMPADPLGRAYARRWMSFADREIIDKDARFTHFLRDKDAKVALCHELLAGLKPLNDELAGKTKYFLGDKLSLVDTVLAPTMPFLQIWSDVIGDKHYAAYRNIQAYYERLQKDATLAKSVFGVPIDVYKGFFGAVLGQGLTVP